MAYLGVPIAWANMADGWPTVGSIVPTKAEEIQ
jgi:hypothetical protein